MARFFYQIFILGVLAFMVYACSGEKAEYQPTQNSTIQSSDSILKGWSERDLFFQHVIYEVPQEYQNHLDSLINYIKVYQPGVVKLNDWNIDSIQMFRSRLDTLDIVQPIYMVDLFEQINMSPIKYWEFNDTLKNPFYNRYFLKSRTAFLDFRDLAIARDEYLDSLAMRKNIHAIRKVFKEEDGNLAVESFLKETLNGVGSYIIKVDGFDTVNFDKLKIAQNFKGFLLCASDSKRNFKLLNNGVDMIFAQGSLEELYKESKENLMESEAFLSTSKSILKLKSNFKDSTSVNHKSEIKFLKENIQLKSTVLLRNESDLFPFKKRFNLVCDAKIKLGQVMREENNIGIEKSTITTKKIDEAIASDRPHVIILPDTSSELIIKKCKDIKKKDNVGIVFSNPKFYEDLKDLPFLIFSPSCTDFNYALLIQQLTGKLAFSSDYVDGKQLIIGEKTEARGLARTSPELVGMNSDTLRYIDYSIRTAMNGRAFPGCQVLLAKNGCIIYDKSFGYHSYERKKLVTSESMYDLASITKVVATTLVGMKLYELNAYSLQDSLIDYFPDSLRQHLDYPSTIRNITFQELFIHKSGLPAGFPIINYMQYTSAEVGRFDKYYCYYQDSSYSIEVAEGFYMQKEFADSMWLRLHRIYLDPAKPYKYSDVSMNTLYYMFSSIIQNNPVKFGFTQPKKKLKDKNLFEEYLYTNFYKPLGMNHSRYKPLRFFNKNSIVPTENEKYWRKQLLQGSVHDPNAALMGGIAGNAGMYSTTNDLVKLLQMLLNKGVYDGKRYLNAETVTKFTSAQEGTHRGLGWNKPTLTSTGYGISDYATLKTFGHTGFTGTCIWVDPSSEIVYIFLSNRVHPDVNNRIYQYGIRKAIHQYAYRSLIHENYKRDY